MKEAYTEELLTAVFGVPGLLLLIWAFFSSQFRKGEPEKFALRGSPEDSDYACASAAKPVNHAKTRLFFAAVVLIFAFVTLCPLVVYLFMAHGPHAASQ